MDRNFHIDDFERLLREKSNEFRMYPSKRIWHSIYNNIHPGRKWPSIAMCITLFTSLLLIGRLNTGNTNVYTGSGINIPPQKAFAQTKSVQLPFANRIDYHANSKEKAGIIANNKTGTASDNKFNSGILNNVVIALLPVEFPAITQASLSKDVDANDSQVGISNLSKKEITDPIITAINSIPVLNDGQIAIQGDYKIPTGNDQSPVLIVEKNKAADHFIERTSIDNFSLPELNKKMAVNIQGGNSPDEMTNLALNKKDVLSKDDQGWVENYALYNRPASKKWVNKLALQMYASPSLVYRTLFNAPNVGNTANTTPIAASTINGDINNAVNHSPSVGFEIGTGLQYSIFKGVKLKAGLQINYTRYNSHAFQNSHPVATRLTMYDAKTNATYEVNRTTPYSNKSGLKAEKLHNETFQLSLPIGADLKLLGNEYFQWNVGVTIQPTYVAGGKSYIISSDRRYYVKETSMLSNWNLNAGFETFISFKNRGLNYQIGPQFRTQLYSTNNRKLAVGEKLANYGLKFGVSKTLK